MEGGVNSAVVVVNERGIQSNLPKTFIGDRGGAAEDADLLAELRAISSKTASRNRFDDDDDDSITPSASCVSSIENANAHDKVVSSKSKSIDEIKEQQAQTLPPWKQKKSVNVALIEDVVLAPTSKLSSRPFQNALRDINSEEGNDVRERVVLPTSENADKLDNDESFFPNKMIAGAVLESNAEPPNPAKGFSSDGHGSLDFGMNGPPPPPSNSDADIKITLEGLDNFLKSAKWQERKSSFLFLEERIKTLSSDSDPSALLNSDEVYESLDQAVIRSLNDKNAGALDAALTLSITYADRCHGACSDYSVTQIVSTLVKGAAFLSSRSSTLSLTEELVLKLIEVAPEGSSSIDVVFELIQTHGLNSNKPKVVIFSAKLIMQSVVAFGASVLPIRTLKASSECLIAHSNAQAREMGLQLLAEMCRALGSGE
jgi:hypothetical protein